MASEEERCAEAAKFQRIDDAFRKGDLDALRAAVDDPAAIPNGLMPNTVGPCLVYAVYHSPLAFIRALLETGADPNAPADDGFPPLIAALSSGCVAPGATKRTDVPDILRLLLAFGADPNQRGINDYTALHMAVDAGDALAVQILLESGADPELRTRIDECETPLEMAEAAAMPVIAAILARKGKPLRERLRAGVSLLVDIPGAGDPVRRQAKYRVRLRLWLNRGESVRWDIGETLFTVIHVERRSVIGGLFYGVEGMRIGGTRRLRIPPHLAYGERGIPGTIPEGAVLTAEITILEAC